MTLQQIPAQTLIDLTLKYPSEYQNPEFQIQLNKLIRDKRLDGLTYLDDSKMKFKSIKELEAEYKKQLEGTHLWHLIGGQMIILGDVLKLIDELKFDTAEFKNIVNVIELKARIEGDNSKWKQLQGGQNE